MGMEKTNDASRVTVVTVTYGERRHFLERMLRAVLAQGVGRIVLVNNGSLWDVSALAAEIDSARIEVLHLEHNVGSAGGFANGISHALAEGAELIWLLDDDNRPEESCLAYLLYAYDTTIAQVQRDRLAVLAFRHDHQADLIQGVPLCRLNHKPGSFWGFHVLDIPYKLWRRTPWGRPRSPKYLPAAIPLETAPYSGLLFHKSLIDTIGLPKADLVLYADDIELTRRLTHLGGTIMLIPSAVMADMEGTWNVKHATTPNSFMMWLQNGGDFRAYYTARNLTWVETHPMNAPTTIYFLNKWLYLILLYITALAKGRLARFNLLIQAIKDGKNGRLGINPHFLLP